MLIWSLMGMNIVRARVAARKRRLGRRAVQRPPCTRYTEQHSGGTAFCQSSQASSYVLLLSSRNKADIVGVLG